MIRAVLLDLDGTLLDRKQGFERFMRDQGERCAVTAGGASCDAMRAVWLRDSWWDEPIDAVIDRVEEVVPIAAAWRTLVSKP